MTTEFETWAFRVSNFRTWDPKDLKPFLAGVYFFPRGAAVTQYRTALFGTRQEARDAARTAHLIGRAIRVKVTIEELP